MSKLMTINTTEDAFHALDSDMGGWCLACGNEAYGVEPDARKYPCESCGEKAVYGAQEALIMGRVHFDEEA